MVEAFSDGLVAGEVLDVVNTVVVLVFRDVMVVVLILTFVVGAEVLVWVVL